MAALTTSNSEDPEWAFLEEGSHSPGDARHAFRKGVLAACGCFLGSLLVIGTTAAIAITVLMETGRIPDSAAVPGHQLHESTLSFLREEGLLEEDERVLYYYSDGTFSFREDGNFFTDQRVISYWLEGDDIVMQSATYPEIADITPKFEDSILGNSEIWLDLEGGEQLYLIVANESDLDEEFVRLLTEIWMENR